jgi:hypothetical protein
VAYGHVYRNDSESNHGNRVSPLGTLRPVTQRQDVATDEESEVKIVEHDVDDFDTRDMERRIFHSTRKNVLEPKSALTKTVEMETHESNVKVTQREPREDQVENLVHQLDVDPEFAGSGMGRAIEVVELDDRVHSSEERSIEPSTTL